MSAGVREVVTKAAKVGSLCMYNVNVARFVPAGRKKSDLISITTSIFSRSIGQESRPPGQRIKQYQSALDVISSEAPWIVFFTTETEATRLPDSS